MTWGVAALLGASNAFGQAPRSFYSIDVDADEFVRVSSEGDVSTIGALGVDFANVDLAAVAIDLIWAVDVRGAPNPARLWQIDPNTGAAFLWASIETDTGAPVVVAEGFTFDTFNLIISYAADNTTSSRTIGALAPTFRNGSPVAIVTPTDQLPPASLIDAGDADSLEFDPGGAGLLLADASGSDPRRNVIATAQSDGTIVDPRTVSAEQAAGLITDMTIRDGQAFSISIPWDGQSGGIARFERDAAGFAWAEVAAFSPGRTLLGLVPAPNACPADINGDGIVTGVDFTDFIAAFATGAPVADQNLDGVVTGVDFTDFIANFAAGCP